MDGFVRNLSMVGEMLKQRNSTSFNPNKKSFSQPWPVKLEEYTIL
jgi:hypothetical protein